MSKRPLQHDGSSPDEAKRRRETSPEALSWVSSDATLHKMMDGIESSFEPIPEQARDFTEISHVQQQQSGDGLTGVSASTSAENHATEDVIAERAMEISSAIDMMSDQLATLHFFLPTSLEQSASVAQCNLLAAQVADVGRGMRGLLLHHNANRENGASGTLQTLRPVRANAGNRVDTSLENVDEDETLEAMAAFSNRLSDIKTRIDTLCSIVGAGTQ